MKRYLVEWEIDAFAENKRAAALDALRAQRSCESIATVFHVRETNENGAPLATSKRTRIDLRDARPAELRLCLGERCAHDVSRLDDTSVACRVLEERCDDACRAGHTVDCEARRARGELLESWRGTPGTFLADNRNGNPADLDFVRNGLPFVLSMGSAYNAERPLFFDGGGGAAPFYRIELFIESEACDGR
jgi:hypothetical protein